MPRRASGLLKETVCIKVLASRLQPFGQQQIGVNGFITSCDRQSERSGKRLKVN